MARRWDGAAAPAPQAGSPTESGKITIAQAVKAFLAEHERNSAKGTIRKYRILMKKLTTYSEYKGFVVLDQWGPRKTPNQAGSA